MCIPTFYNTWHPNRINHLDNGYGFFFNKNPEYNNNLMAQSQGMLPNQPMMQQ
jgi:hypothetical protein